MTLLINACTSDSSSKQNFLNQFRVMPESSCRMGFLGRGRHIAVNDNGDLYVKLRQVENNSMIIFRISRSSALNLAEMVIKLNDVKALSLAAHAAPKNLLFYTGDMFPKRYKNGAFVALHGSWNRIPYPQVGYSVVFIPFKNGEPTGTYEEFATGFSGKEEIKAPAKAKYRPTGLAQGPDGSLFIIDSVKGLVWRVYYYE